MLGLPFNVDLQVFDQVAQVQQHRVGLDLIGGDQRVQLFVELPERRHPVGGGHGVIAVWW
ncbi:MAG: hypothetical protein EBV32_02555 [Proteobacteria bacterium]|uniref:Uncharacterized protein n=1 Tax=Candidatus Fonsibacter lacus TaxID=2576439 RepID=A0A964V2Q2_9PROT|nr:hypothetical protein [Candidatus Fonsibacter lacus]